MAVLNPTSQSLELLYVRSISASGKPVMETRRFKNLKVAATPDSIHEVATAIGALSVGTFAQYQVTVASELAAV